jgi:hypothetical protein
MKYQCCKARHTTCTLPYCIHSCLSSTYVVKYTPHKKRYSGVLNVVTLLTMPGLPNLWHAERFPWQPAFIAALFLLILYDRHFYTVMNMCTYTHLTAWMRCMNYRCYQIIMEWNIYTQTGSGAKCWLDVYHLGAGLEVTGWIRDTGQNVLRSSFQTGSSSNPSYFRIFFLAAFLDDFITNTITTLRINYKIKMN